MKNEKIMFINRGSSRNYYLTYVPEMLVGKRGSEKCWYHH